MVSSRTVSLVFWRTWDLETTVAAASVRETKVLLMYACNIAILFIYFLNIMHF